MRLCSNTGLKSCCTRLGTSHTGPHSRCRSRLRSRMSLCRILALRSTWRRSSSVISAMINLTITCTRSQPCWLCMRCCWCRCSQERTISACNKGSGSVRMTSPICSRRSHPSSSASFTSASTPKTRRCRGRRTATISRFSARSTASSTFRTEARTKTSLSLKLLRISCNLRLTKLKKRRRSSQGSFQGNAQTQQPTLKTSIRKMQGWVLHTKLTWSCRR